MKRKKIICFVRSSLCQYIRLRDGSNNSLLVAGKSNPSHDTNLCEAAIRHQFGISLFGSNLKRLLNEGRILPREERLVYSSKHQCLSRASLLVDVEKKSGIVLGLLSTRAL